MCLLATYDGVIRTISPLEAIAGSPDSTISGRENRIKYLESKLSSITRAFDGKKEAGIDSAEEENLISALTELISSERNKK